MVTSFLAKPLSAISVSTTLVTTAAAPGKVVLLATGFRFV